MFPSGRVAMPPPKCPGVTCTSAVKNGSGLVDAEPPSEPRTHSENAPGAGSFPSASVQPGGSVAELNTTMTEFAFGP
ncbi:hypothetical protein ACHAXS_011194 [Conticribra weissflogii]